MQATTTQGGVEMETSNIIEVTHLNKQFLVDKQPMEVLHDINLQVKKENSLPSWDTADAEKHIAKNYLRACWL